MIVNTLLPHSLSEVVDHVVMGQHDTLGQACGAAAVGESEDGGAGVNVHILGEPGPIVIQECGEWTTFVSLTINNDDLLFV